ncbi:hypothetical protein GXW83_15110 [Streptacidiphilus sp. PB12-B1b]|uniref:hypothetical protein n=1 Tax=Streptacidiphilus TaxID=228398 RepID=UPI00068EC66D|nr:MULTISPECIES: hypothetical protein [Streptacidiphilus]QMU76863.1 hypothetical protein GXW83_15110 [Streptacidiphilus sp. PB12-B1b]
MTTPAHEHHLASATFSDDEPVFASLPGQIPDRVGPTFARTDAWPATNVRRPASRVPARWSIPLPAEPRQNLLVREVAFCLLNPTHSALRRAGIFLKANQWAMASAVDKSGVVAILARWGEEQGLLDDFGRWRTEDWQAFIDDRAEITSPSNVRRYVSVVRHLVTFAPVLTGISTFSDPWPGKTASEVADSPYSDDLSTVPIPPEIWWPLLRAAWAYIDRFAPTILARRDLKQAPHPQQTEWSLRTPDRLLEAWLADPETRIPVTGRARGTVAAGEPMWNEISRQVQQSRRPTLFLAPGAGRARQARILHWIAETGRTYAFDRAIHRPYRPDEATERRQLPDAGDEALKRWLADPANIIPMHPADANVDWAGKPNWNEISRLVYGVETVYGPLHCQRSGIEQRRAWIVEAAQDPARTRPNEDGMTIRMLRAACYVFVAALTAMRTSEIQEIARGAVTQHYGAPAIRSRKVKHDQARPHQHWWIIEPVAQTLAVAEQITWHETRVFTSLTPALGQDGGGYAVHTDIDDFIATVNANRHHTGLEEIPPAYVRPHMFRRTMAVLAAQEPDGEIALGIQLKHAAGRALSNRLTLSYGKADTRWAKEFDNQMERSAAKKLVALLQDRRLGQTIAVGPAAARFHASLDKINNLLADDPVLRAQIADERLQATLLQGEFANLHLGTVNHCLWNASTAECQNQLPADQRGQSPLLGACQPARCRNSVLTPAHEKVWRMEEAQLLGLLTTKLSKYLREQAEARLADVRSTNAQFDKMKATS